MRSKRSIRAKSRLFEFRGLSCQDDILIGNHGNARLIAKGTFQLSGIVYCRQHTMEFIVDGTGSLTFHGRCKKLKIISISGNCILDVRQLKSDLVECQVIQGNSEVVIGQSKLMTCVNLYDNAVLKIIGYPLIFNSTLTGDSRIIHI